MYPPTHGLFLRFKIHKKTGLNGLSGTIPLLLRHVKTKPEPDDCLFCCAFKKLGMEWLAEGRSDIVEPLVHLKTLSLREFMHKYT